MGNLGHTGTGILTQFTLLMPAFTLLIPEPLFTKQFRRLTVRSATKD